MAFVAVPKDLNKVKSKVLFNLTQRLRTPGRWCRYSAGHGALIPVSWCTPSAGDGAPVPPSKVHGGRRRWCTAAMLGLSL